MATKKKSSSGSETVTASQEQKAQPKAESVGPGKTTLLERFSAGQIPLAGDFAELIEVADVGRRAAGRSPDQSGAAASPGAGLGLDAQDRLEIRPAATNSGLNVSDGVKVGEGAGIAVVGDAVTVKGNTAKAIEVSVDGVGVNIGSGLKADSNAIAAAINTGSLRYDANRNLDVNYNYVVGTNKYSKGLWTFNVGPSGGEQRPVLGVNMSATGGLHIANELNGQIGIKLADKSGLQVGTTGLAVNPGAGLMIDNDGKLNATVTSTGFVIGMIVMFSGTDAQIPDDWAICNGQGGTPDLSNRFVLGSATATTGSAGGATWNATSKSFQATTTAEKPNITVTVNDHILTPNEMPAHSHQGGFQIEDGTYSMQAGYYGAHRTTKHAPNEMAVRVLFNATQNVVIVHRTETIGGGQGHTHTATVGNQTHSHSVPVSPPHYVLAFIMKVR